MAGTHNKPHALLIFPPVYDFALFDLFVRPYSLLKLGRWLSDAGYEVTMINSLDYRESYTKSGLKKPVRRANGTGKFFRRVVPTPPALHTEQRPYARYGIPREALEKQIGSVNPDIILVGSGMTYWYPGVREVVSLAKMIHPRTPVVVGGIYATLCPEHARRTMEADEIVTGDAYPALAQLLAASKLPVPASAPTEDYLLDPSHYYDACVVRLHAGCVFHCSYCASHKLCGGFRPGDPEHLARQVELIHRRFGINTFAFYDDALLAQRHTGIIPFLTGIIETGITLDFYVPNGLHITYLDESLAALMKKAGFSEVRFGFESARAGFHREYGPKHEVSMLEHAVHCLRSGGFAASEIAVYVLAGLPGQYPEEVEESIRFAATLGLLVYVAQYSPIPYTGLWSKSVKQSGFALEEEPLTHNNTLFPLQGERFSLQDLQKLKGLAQRFRHAELKSSS